ncbi:helix-turn-helix domain-containing protein [Microbacterium sp. NPDC089190]|uniref:helix-turn-helix domain-containing protein n=1 Tax=Microbacterium sp. NPDC089190 TaxID=3155063 RepID=UPI00344B0D2D
MAHYRKHGSVVGAANALGVTRQTAGKHLAQAGLVTIRRMSAADIVVAQTAYEHGESAASIGRRLGFSTHTVLKAVKSECGATSTDTGT